MEAGRKAWVYACVSSNTPSLREIKREAHTYVCIYIRNMLYCPFRYALGPLQ